MFRNPKTRRKITLMAPPLALGQAVHATIESISTIPTPDRFSLSLIDRFEAVWKTVSGKKGGFTDPEQEKEYKERGIKMMERIMKNPGPLTCKTVRIKQDLPHYWLSEEENIILCGKIDWLIYKEENDTVQILDFKSGRMPEKQNSLQLPIYYLLAKNTQSREVTGVCYWYLEKDDEPISATLPSLIESKERVLEAARRIKLARQMDHFKCSSGNKEGCIHCAPLEIIVNGKAEFVGVNEYNNDIFIINDKKHNYSLSEEI